MMTTLLHRTDPKYADVHVYMNMHEIMKSCPEAPFEGSANNPIAGCSTSWSSV
jgi:hypothetical protein